MARGIILVQTGELTPELITAHSTHAMIISRNLDGVSNTHIYISCTSRSEAHHSGHDWTLSIMGLHPVSSSPFRSVIARTFVVLWLFISHASSAVIVRDVNTMSGLPISNMTRLQHTLNVSSVANSQNYHCTNNWKWIGREKGYEITDCFNARVKFWKEMVVTHKAEQHVEYMGYHAVSTTRLEKIQTPLRFTSGKWVFTISLVFYDQGPNGLIVRTCQ